MDIIQRSTVFSTPWFDVIAKTTNEDGEDAPYYSLQLPDYVSVLAVTTEQEILLVRQYRPTVEEYTLELPSGHLEDGESPEQTARRELLEETGYTANDLELLGCLVPDTGRLSNRLWCYFARDVERSTVESSTSDGLEPGVELVVCHQNDLVKYILEQRFNHALHVALFLLAGLKGKLELF